MSRLVAHGRAVAGAALLSVLLSVALGATPAGSDAPDRSGWWWQPNGGFLPIAVPAPPGIPPGALFVAVDPGGVRAIGALHLTSSTTAPRSMQLEVENQVGTPSVLACSVTGPWEAADGGEWDQRPRYDCARSAPGMPSADGTTISFDVSVLTEAGVVDVAVVPALDADLATFQVTFAPPGADTFSSEAPPTTVPPPTTVDVATPPSGPMPEVASGAPALEALPIPAGQAAPGSLPSRAGSPRRGSVASQPITEARPLESAWVRYVGATIFALLVGSFLVTNGVLPVPWAAGAATAGAGGEGSGEQRGLGRFRQERAGAAPLL
jgi:hypothetical protein